MWDKHVVHVCVCVRQQEPPRSRSTVGNEGIKNREQITVPEDNEMISHLQLSNEGEGIVWC